MSDATPESAAAAARRLTPADVQQQVFRRALFRGYNEQDVDDFLDRVTEEVALLLDEHRQLREQSGVGLTQPLSGGQEVGEAKRMADDILRRAREEAAEFRRKAVAGAAGAAGGGTAGLQPFLAQERTFLQELSRLIQSHADTVRDMARAVRTRGAAPATPQAPPSGTVSAAPAAEESGGDQGAPSEPAQTEAEKPAAANAARSEPTREARTTAGPGPKREPSGDDAESLKELFWGEKQ